MNFFQQFDSCWSANIYLTCIICIAADVSQSETTTNSRNKKGNTGTISTGITTGTISTGITVESSV